MDKRLIEPYIKSAKYVIQQMTDIEIEQSGEPYDIDGDMPSFGVTSVVNFAGKIKGRIVLDIIPELALKMVENMMGEPCKLLKDRLFVAGISELNNIISGDANTYINNTYSLGLRLTPPIVFTGNKVVLLTSKIDSATIPFNTPYGKLNLNIGFQGEVD